MLEEERKDRPSLGLKRVGKKTEVENKPRRQKLERQILLTVGEAGKAMIRFTPVFNKVCRLERQTNPPPSCVS